MHMSEAPMALLATFHDTIPTTSLQSVLAASISNNRPIALIIVGPSGSGKTTLAKASAVAAGLQIRRLTPRLLSADDAAEIEHGIATTFRQPDDNGPLAVIMEDLDLWAPANPRSPADFRIIASLGDELTALRETPSTIIFVATAVAKDAVYPGLFRQDRISVVVKLSALTVAERTRLCLRWFEEMFGMENGAEAAARKMATITPGYVHADMQRLFNDLAYEIERRRATKKFTSGIDQLLEASWVRDIFKAAKSSLLTASDGSYVAKESKVQSKVCGLDAELQQCRECLRSVYAVTSDYPVDDIEETVGVLRRLGTLKGLILHGATGCGKSAIANLAPSMLPSNTVNSLRADATSIVSSVIGEAERKLCNLFVVARAIAPTLITIENIDILAPNRDFAELDGGSAVETFNRLLSTLLTEIDGVGSRSVPSLPVFVIGTTRSIKLIDPALLRPGRLELHIGVRAPDADARVELLKSFLESRGEQLQEAMESKSPFTLERFVLDSEGWTAPDVFAFGRELIFDKATDRIYAERCERGEGPSVR